MLNAKVKSLQKQLAEGHEPHHQESRSNKVGELERVITAMKKVIEKLQVENENLKRSNAASTRQAQTRTEAGKKLTTVQEENSRLKVSLACLAVCVVGILCIHTDGDR